MSKGLIYLMIFIGGAIGSYLPILLGDNGGMFSGWSILGGLVGSLLGIWAAVKIGNYV